MKFLKYLLISLSISFCLFFLFQQYLHFPLEFYLNYEFFIFPFAGLVLVLFLSLCLFRNVLILQQSLGKRTNNIQKKDLLRTSLILGCLIVASYVCLEIFLAAGTDSRASGYYKIGKEEKCSLRHFVGFDRDLCY